MPTPADDAFAIEALKARYCAAVDRLPEDSQSLQRIADELFVDSVVADYGGGPLEGAGALTGFLAGAVAANSTWMIHMFHSPLIVINGDEATGEWTMLARMKRLGGRIDEVLGRYRDRFVRTADGWRIASIRFVRIV